MAVTLSPLAGAGWQFFDNFGNPLSGGLIYTYSAGTTTPLATFTTINGNIQHSNPIVLDSSGRVPEEVWITVGYGYKFVFKDANGVLIRTYDNIPSNAPSPFANDASSVAYEQGYTVTAGDFVVGDSYMITSLGNTNFMAIGASANELGIHFTATGVGSGTGQAEFSRSVQTKLRETVSVGDFGAVGDSVTDDTLAIRAACAYLQSVGGGQLDFESKTYLVYSDTNDTDYLGDFDGLNGIVFNGNGATLLVTRNFNANEAFWMFRTHDCVDVEFSNFILNATGTRTSIYNDGASFFKDILGGFNFKFSNIKAYNFSQVIAFKPEGTGNPSRNVFIEDFYAEDTGYPFFCDTNGYNVKAHYTTYHCGRGYFCYNPQDHDVQLVSDNSQALSDVLLYAAGGGVCRNLKLNYTGNTTTAMVGTRYAVSLYFRDEAAATIENIDFNIKVLRTGSVTPHLAALVVDKLTQAGAQDTVVRGHKFINFKCSGYTDTSSSPINFLSQYFVGETVKTVAFENLWMGSAQSAFRFDGVQDVALMKDIYTSALVNLYGSATTGKVMCVGVTANCLTPDATEASYVDYYSCIITLNSPDAAKQSTINKNFYSTKLGSNYVTQLIGNPTASSFAAAAFNSNESYGNTFCASGSTATLRDMSTVLTDSSIGQIAFVAVTNAAAGALCMVTRMGSTYSVSAPLNATTAGTVSFSMSGSNLQITNNIGAGYTFYHRQFRVLDNISY